MRRLRVIAATFALRYLKQKLQVEDRPIELIVTPQNTIEVRAALDDFQITIQEPQEFAGTYDVTLEQIVESLLYGEGIELIDGLSIVPKQGPSQ